VTQLLAEVESLKTAHDKAERDRKDLRKYASELVDRVKAESDI
jgi:hypothetical protein